MDRPLYKFTVINEDQDWTYTATHDPDQRLSMDDVTVILADGLSMGWGFTNDQVPGPLDADTCSFKLYVKAAEYMPDIDPGDVIVANLERPGPGGTFIPYMRFTGRASDPDLDLSPSKGLYVSVQATGNFEDLTADVPFEDVFGAAYTDGWLVDEAMAIIFSPFNDVSDNGVYIQNNWRMFPHHTYLPGSSLVLSDLLARIEASLDGAADGPFDPDHTWFYALRTTYNWRPVSGPGDNGWVHTTSAPNRPVSYYFEGAPLVMPDAMVLVEDDTDPDMVVLGMPGPPPSGFPIPEARPDVTVISSRHVVSPASLRKTRSDIVNNIDISGIDHSGATNKEVRKRYRDASSVARYGTATRSVDTTRAESSLPGLGQKYLYGSSGGGDWSLPEIQVITGNMDDDELDQLAPVFYPHAPNSPYGGHLARFFALADLPERIALGEKSELAVQLVGATFNVSDGDITITPRFRALPPADFTTSITFDELAASPLADTTFEDVGVHYIDPTLDIDELIYTDI